MKVGGRQGLGGYALDKAYSSWKVLSKSSIPTLPGADRGVPLGKRYLLEWACPHPIGLLGLFHFAPHSKKNCGFNSFPLPSTQEELSLLDFSGGSVVKSPHFHCRGHGFNPWSGN